MFEDTVLRFSDKERQQQLAEQEQALAQRRVNLDARQKNLAYRYGRDARCARAGVS